VSNSAITTTESIDLPYEIEHMRAAYRLLPLYGAQDPQLRNLIIESFWVHARNLIEMFLEKSNSVNPRRMAASGYAPLDGAKLQTFYSSICKQITHLKAGRPVTGKLNCRDPEFINLIEAEIAHFIAQVRPDVHAYLGPDKIGEPMIPDHVPLGPSGQTGTVSGWTGPRGP